MSHNPIIPYPKARQQLKTSSAPTRWAAIVDGFRGEVWPEFTPSFHIAPGHTVFTMGSCFARNIETHLAMLGCRVPMMDFDLPPDEWSGNLHGAMNRFHPPAFRQSIEWTARIFDRDGQVLWEDCEAIAFDCGGGRFFDLDMGATAPVGMERFIARRQHIYEIFRNVFRADCLMLTPGLIEAWRDRSTGQYTFSGPTLKETLAEPDRWEVEVLSYETCLSDLLAVIDIVRARNPEIKVLVTTSPVPMSATFTGKDVRIANSYSKSVLRAVCGAVAMERPLVDYFPSYESVTLSFPKGVWKDDRLHVSHSFIAKIVARMLDKYFDDMDEVARGCQLARTHLLDKDFGGAERTARAVLETTDHVETRALLAEALFRQGRREEAEQELQILVEADPERADFRLLLARVLGQDGWRSREAVSHVEAAIALPSLTLASFRQAADIVRRHAPPALAESITRGVTERFPLHVESYQPLVDVLVDQGRRLEAIAVLRQALTLRRVRAGMLTQLAGLLAEEGDTAEAVALLKRALDLDANHEAARLQMARLSPDRFQTGQPV